MNLARIVVDANVIVSALLKDSFTRRMLLGENAPKLFSPEFIRQELAKYSGEFSKKLHADRKELEETLEMLFDASKITVLPKPEYSEFMPKAMQISPDPKDTAYLALALKLDCPIWSNDSALKKQSRVKVYATAELAEELRNAKT